MGRMASSSGTLQAAGLRLAIVASRYNEVVCEGLLEGALQELQTLGLPRDKIQIMRVPGAFELPLAAAWMIQTGRVDGVLCLGAVVRGESSHFDYVCQGTTEGIQRVMLDTGVPVAFGVLTTEDQAQALARSGQDENNKGREAARTAVEMVLLKNNL